MLFIAESHIEATMHRATVLLLVLLMATPVALGQVEPNRRSEPALTGSSTFAAAALADFTHHIVGGTLDPAPAPGPGLLSDSLHTNVWFMWDSSGGRLQAGHADTPNCDPNSATPDVEALATLCDGDAVAVAVSQNGDRAVVASHVGSARSRLLLITAQQGLRFGMEVSGLIQAVDLDGPGDRIAVAVAGSGSEVPHRVLVLGWLNTSPPILELLLENAPIAIDLSTEGSLVVFAAGAAHRVPIGSGGTHGNLIQSVARDVAVASDSAHWSVAGYANGEVAVFSKDHTPTQAFSRHPSNQAQQAVAIREDANGFAAGDAAGILRYYSLDREAATGALADTRTLDAGITDIAFSRDGTYLIAGSSAGEVALFRVAAKLEPIWTDRLPARVVSVDISADGEVAMAASGSEIAIYPALHQLIAPPLSPITVAPRAVQNVTVAYQNAGNRAETVTVTPGAPDGWSATANPATFVIPLQGQGETRVQVSVPAFTPPGRYTIAVAHSLGGRPAGETPLLVDVAEQRGWGMTVGAPSKAVTPGQTVTFPVVVQNQGNVADGTGLAVSVDRADWIATVTPPRLDLAAGATANVTISLQAPAEAAELDAATVTLVVEAQRSVTFAFTGKVGAAFQPTLLVPSSARVVQGESALIPLSVRNDGNAPDSFDLSISGAPLLWTVVFETGLPTHRFNSVGPGETATVNLKVQAPFDADVNQTVVLRGAVMSLGDPTRSDARTFLVGVQPAEAGEVEAPEEESPGVSVLGVLLAVGLLAARRRPGKAAPMNRKG